MAKRFLVKKSDILIKVVRLIMGDMPLMKTECRVVTGSNYNDTNGSCRINKLFPFDCYSLEITWNDNNKAEDYLETIIHELTHVQSNGLGFMRNSIPEEEKVNVDECYASLTGAISRNLYENYPAIKKLLDQFVKTPKED